MGSTEWGMMEQHTRLKVGDRAKVADIPIGYKIKEDCGCEYTRIKHTKEFREYLEENNKAYQFNMKYHPEKLEKMLPFIYCTHRCEKHQEAAKYGDVRLRGWSYNEVTVIRTTYRKKK